ncbi:hypothetical protein [uncultured Microbulbifer sp.]|uniref:hypothetical protein n=1 Tax=uncultured Microbulbifer sp. TaxID=348147 RepID=UPI00263679D9|nr:hypothetical protein [uncultured Microbulbifer sp.]
MQELQAVGAQTKETSYKYNQKDIVSTVHQLKDTNSAVSGMEQMKASWTKFYKDTQALDQYYQNDYIGRGDSNRTFSQAVRHITSTIKSGWG